MGRVKRGCMKKIMKTENKDRRYMREDIGVKEEGP